MKFPKKLFFDFTNIEKKVTKLEKRFFIGFDEKSYCEIIYLLYARKIDDIEAEYCKKVSIMIN